MEAALHRLIQTISDKANVQPFDLTDRGLLLADGVFDTSLVVNGQVRLRQRHIARLQSDAAALGIEVTVQELEALVDVNLPPGGNGALRLTVTRGPGARGLAGDTAARPTKLARFSPMERVFPAPPVRLMVSPIHRNPASPSARHKTLAYTDNVMALRGALAAGHDDALLLSPVGHVACASAANVFARFGDRLVTPPLADGALAGITRGWLLERTAEEGISADESHLTPEALAEADSLFLTNSLRIFQPVGAFAGRAYDTALPAGLKRLGEALLEGAYDD